VCASWDVQTRLSSSPANTFGPDRRAADRSSAIRRFFVPLTVRAKLRGQNLDYADYAKKIAPVVKDMIETRLNAQSSRLTSVCKELAGYYAASQITPLVQEKIRGLGDLLRDAAATARQLEQDDVSALCLSLVERVDDFAARYTTPTEKDMEMLRKIADAVAMAARTGVAVDSKATGLSTDDQPTPAEELEDEPALEIQFIPKGQQLFKEGDEATDAYVVAAGCIGIFRKVGGKTSPVARIRKGEFFGEMAILDGSKRRAMAVAIEDTTVSLISKEVLEDKMTGTDKLIRTILLSAVHNLRAAHDNYTQRGRSLKDMFDTLDLSVHIAKRHCQRIDMGDDQDQTTDLLDQFRAALKELQDAAAPAIDKDQRDNQILNADEIQEAAE